ncbi:RDD family protein [Vibrio coralliilyticus]|uniref:RDD family protein n=1 Tax=Vibrio coralliilyticus TaxID=190893 RepID=UPI0018435693|nr:RDD family protein [Vibrio coralliilyticus]NUW69597.1 RDD family protein [Vibrio coralliilyticus]
MQPEVVSASRWSRFWAGFCDSLIMMVFIVPLVYFAGFMDTDRMNEAESTSLASTFFLLSYSLLVYLLCNGYLLHKKGQTIGKNVFGIAIVDSQGSSLGLKRIFFKRYIPTVLFHYIPLIGGLLALADTLCIFRKDKRCIHDLIAGSQVISIAVTNQGNVKSTNTGCSEKINQ